MKSRVNWHGNTTTTACFDLCIEPLWHPLAPMSFTYPHHVASFFDCRSTTLRPHQGFERDVANLFLRLQFTQPRRIRGIEKSRRRRNTHAANHSIGRGRRRHHGGHGSSNRWVEQSIHVQCFCLNALFQCFNTLVQLLWFNYFGSILLFVQSYFCQSCSAQDLIHSDLFPPPPPPPSSSRWRQCIPQHAGRASTFQRGFGRCTRVRGC